MNANKFTVIYSEYSSIGSQNVQQTRYICIVCEPGQLQLALTRNGIEMSQVTQVFHGHPTAIMSDWSKL